MNPESRISNRESDHESRRRAVEETGSSFVVEASAGTGKTRTLLDRILHLVLEKGPGGSPTPLSRICAITFTEKAAGEMKVRLRQYLEQTLLDAESSAGRLERAREALNDLETAAISTFHSFAVSLLKERPIEAGLDPRFTALDDVRGELFFREAWELWINRKLMERDPVLERALRNGFRLESLKNLAQILCRNWLSIRDLECDAPQEEEQYLTKIQEFLESGRDYVRLLLKPEDKLALYLEQALNWLRHPADDAAELSKPGRTGSAANWRGGKDTVQAVQGFLREVVEFRTMYRNLPVQQLLKDVVGWISEDFMIGEWEKRKLAGGLLDFDDQLRMARDLLLRNKAVRREFQLQYKTLLVDEFQDTDPIQWEIVLLLTSANIEENDFVKLRPEPGRLFIVGDPKQSIYRFRNADIETYLEIVHPSRLGSLRLSRLNLTTNFRSVPSILGFVDAAFRDVMRPADEGVHYQPDYLAFGGSGDRKMELHPPSVNLLGDDTNEEDGKRTTSGLVKLESKRIAKLLLEMHGSESWKIQDASEKSGDRWRVPQYGDMAILLPVLTHADALEEELREMGIPYVLEGGKFYYARSEVSSAITVLRAVANPNDSVALYGSLRSIFFGLSDEDLLRAHIEGVLFDYREKAPRESPLCHPFEILHDLHRHRHRRRASESFEILLQKTGAREVLAVRGFQTLANLSKVGRTLRALQGDLTFSQVVDLLGTMDEEGLAESESRLMEERSNAVRIMTIHKAKGLDFPIVIVAALGLGRKARSRNLLADPRGRRVYALNIGSAESGLRTPGWKELSEEEKKRENAELVRLLYVALTRARDHVILSTHTPGRKRSDDCVQWMPAAEGTRLEPLGPFLKECYSGNSKLVRIIDAAELDGKPAPAKSARPPAAMDFQAILSREYKELRALLANTPSSGILKAAGQMTDATETEDRPAEDRTPEIAGNRSIRLGVAFHEAMERVDLFGADGLFELPQGIATRHRLDPANKRVLESMMRASLESELLNRARAAARSKRRVFRELPFVRPLDSTTIEEGKIDLLFEDEAGWVLVDYKTDWVAKGDEHVEEFFRNKYAGQIREYVDALRALSISVSSAYLLLARTGEAVRMI